jgi:23S rRNA pseudouridine2604 synthase
MEPIPYPVRINRYLALTGISTRKQADVLIAENKVTINGKPAKIGDKVSKGDNVKVSGNVSKEYSYIAYYKPKEIVTHSAQKGEKDISMVVKNKTVFPIGRLDKDSEGLIVLTDDGRVTDRLLNPKYEHEKEYEVVVDKFITKDFEKRMQNGLVIEGYRTKKCKVKVTSTKKFNITLIEGKKHQIRRMCAALGYQVQSLKRVRVMNIEIGNLKPNETRQLSKIEREKFLTLLALS